MAATNTWYFGNGEWVMANGLAVDNYQLAITYVHGSSWLSPDKLAIARSKPATTRARWS